jgi:hypothetical protein
MIKKIIFTDSPEETDRKYYEKFIMTRDPSGFIKYIDGMK